MVHRDQRSPVSPIDVQFRHGCKTELCKQVGFTLLEMIVASVLLVVLMSVVLRSLHTVLQESRADQFRREPITEVLASQIRRDLTNARQFRASSNLLELSGFIAQEPLTGKPLLTWAMVSYRIHSTREGTVLLREQRSASDSPARLDIVQPVWVGAASLSLSTSIIESDEGKSTDSNRAWQALPKIIELTLFDVSMQPIFNETMVRAENSQ